ncbi:MAG: hypothetical protein JXD22_16400 [Sedimentisphaerales bacterium]|nr:hypothetical protein [Sedimentisphaerales bacterium]
MTAWVTSYQLSLDRIRRDPQGVSTLPLVAAVFGNSEIQIPIRSSYPLYWMPDQVGHDKSNRSV